MLRVRRRGAVPFAALAMALAVLGAGCGVPVQEVPAPLSTNPVPVPPEPATQGVHTVRVYLLREGRLFPADRRTEDRSTASLVEVLTEGPTGAEKADGVTTALVPGTFRVSETAASPARPTGTVAVVEVPEEFTQVAGDLQLLATAQLVWTLTERGPGGAVRMAFEGEPIELPTDRGLTRSPVRREDFSSVAPG